MRNLNKKAPLGRNIWHRSSDYITSPTIVVVLGVAVLSLTIFSYLLFFSAPEQGAALEEFVIPRGAGSSAVFTQLAEAGLVEHLEALRVALKLQDVTSIRPGGYTLSKSMSPWEVASVFSRGPEFVWVVIPEGMRKEEIAEILKRELGWDEGTKDEWLNKFTLMKFDYVEGVYFPETYLIPIDEAPLAVAERLQAKFNEKFEPYAEAALKQNIKWDTALKVASIVQREAAGKGDMPLVAGILWNRLLKGMKLEVDATVQYARDNELLALREAEGNVSGKSVKLWRPIKVSDKQIDSPYNTYRYPGLPPHPISNPGINAIKAAINPEKTKCLYYIHDNQRNIHCAVTYAEQVENVELYLK